MTFPLSSYKYEIPDGDHAGAFGAVRKYDIHAGVDLYCEEGDAVRAMEPGVVVSIEDFTGESADSPWWNETKAILVEGESGVILYGEIIPADDIDVGDEVLAHAYLGKVTPVLKVDKGKNPMNMLHMELYKPGTFKRPVKAAIWNLGKAQPKDLLDVTQLLKDNL